MLDLIDTSATVVRFLPPLTTNGGNGSTISYTPPIAKDTSSRLKEDSSTSVASSYISDSVQVALLRDLVIALQWARVSSEPSDPIILGRAAQEALRLITSNLFTEVAYPRIRVDSYGEFCFIIETESGYADIGVRGEGEISYHIRNDQRQLSVFDDVELVGDLPRALREALQEM